MTDPAISLVFQPDCYTIVAYVLRKIGTTFWWSIFPYRPKSFWFLVHVFVVVLENSDLPLWYIRYPKRVWFAVRSNAKRKRFSAI